MLGACFVLLILSSLCFAEKMGYPKNARLVRQDYRSMMIMWDRMKNFNSSGQSTGEWYEIQFEIDNAPWYFPQYETLDLTYQDASIYLNRLLLNTKIKCRIGLKSDRQQEVEFSPYVVFGTESVDPELEIELPGKVTNIKVNETEIMGNTSRVQLGWEAPSNIRTSKNPQVQNIQYTVQKCIYNQLADEEIKCQIVSEVLHDISVTRQTTRLRLLYENNVISLPRNQNIAFLVTGVALNGIEGPSTRAVVRLDPASEPLPPRILTAVVVDGANDSCDVVTLSWHSDFHVQAFRVQYNIKGSPPSTSLVVKEPTIKLELCSKVTVTYETRVAVDQSTNGTSEYSPALTVQIGKEKSSSDIVLTTNKKLLAIGILMTIMTSYAQKLIE